MKYILSQTVALTLHSHLPFVPLHCAYIIFCLYLFIYHSMNSYMAGYQCRVKMSKQNIITVSQLCNIMNSQKFMG
jgi:hypothetical protein